VVESELGAVVGTSLRELDLRPFEHKLAGRLSGGNKRKLSVAITMIGSPPIVFLDEPMLAPLLNQKHAWPFCPVTVPLRETTGHQPVLVSTEGVGRVGAGPFHGARSRSMPLRGAGITTAPWAESAAEAMIRRRVVITGPGGKRDTL